MSHVLGGRWHETDPDIPCPKKPDLRRKKLLPDLAKFFMKNPSYYDVYVRHDNLTKDDKSGETKKLCRQLSNVSRTKRVKASRVLGVSKDIRVPYKHLEQEMYVYVYRHLLATQKTRHHAVLDRMTKDTMKLYAAMRELRRYRRMNFHEYLDRNGRPIKTGIDPKEINFDENFQIDLARHLGIRNIEARLKTLQELRFVAPVVSSIYRRGWSWWGPVTFCRHYTLCFDGWYLLISSSPAVLRKELHRESSAYLDDLAHYFTISKLEWNNSSLFDESFILNSRLYIFPDPNRYIGKIGKRLIRISRAKGHRLVIYDPPPDQHRRIS